MFCSDAINAPHHRRAEVVINPTCVGTGLKVKTVEALSHGRAFVGTCNSVEGLPSSDPPPFIDCRDWGEFASAVCIILSSVKVRKEYERRALEYSRMHFGREKVYGKLKEWLEKTLGED